MTLIINNDFLDNSHEADSFGIGHHEFYNPEGTDAEVVVEENDNWQWPTDDDYVEDTDSTDNE